MILLNQYITHSSVSTGNDVDAQLYIDALGTLTVNEQTAVNNLVVNLKTDGIWDSIHALYPLVWSNASDNKWNLKNPLDTDIAYRLDFNGAITHNSSGIQGDGSTGYADTHFDATIDAAGTSDFMIGVHKIGVEGSGTDRYYIGTGNNNFLGWRSDIEQSSLAGSNDRFPTSQAQQTGFIAVSRANTSNARYYLDGVEIDSKSSNGSFDNRNFLILAQGSTPSAFALNSIIKLAIISDGLTGTEMTDLDASFDTFLSEYLL